MFMVMYMFHIAFGISLIALVMGLAMMKCCCNRAVCEANGGKCCKCGKALGLIISILALISLGCTVHTFYKQMNSGMMERMDRMHNDDGRNVDLQDNVKNNRDMNKDMKKDNGVVDQSAPATQY